jgi:hypothetical protein
MSTRSSRAKSAAGRPFLSSRRAERVEIAVASVHALAARVDVGTAVTAADHQRIRRAGLDRAIDNDLVVAALAPRVAGRRFLVGGDWNDSPLFDTSYPKEAYGVAEPDPVTG